jgi:hypothetical protein
MMSTTRQWVRPASTVTIAIIGLAGCGGSGKHSTPTPPPQVPPVQALSKRQLVKRAQAICLQAQSATGKLIPPPKGESVADYLAKSAEISADRTAKLAALTPTRPVAARWHELLSAEQAFNERMQTMQRAADAGDRVKLKIVQSDLAPAQALIGSARAIGADLCAQ